MKRLILIPFCALLAFLLWQWATFPDVASLATKPPTTTAFMEQRKKTLRSEGKDDTIEFRWVSYEKISPYLRRAALVAEDNAFYEHEGVDVKGLKEALRKDWKQRKMTHGGSTITQQLAKNLYLSPSRNPWRKVKEFFIARALERDLSKKRILELYLNVAEFGERTYGAEAAARHYFNVSAAKLSSREAALLAGALPNPRVMNPGNPNKRLRARQRMILSRMRRWGYLFEKEVLTEKKPVAEEKESGTPVETIDTSIPEVPAEGTATESEPVETTTEAPVDSEPAPPAVDTQSEAEPVPADTSATSVTEPPPGR